MSEAKFTGGEWFLGTVQVDRDEDGWDGKVWAPPTPEDIAAERSPEGQEQGFQAEPVVVATVEHEPDARLVAAAPKLLAALKRVLQMEGWIITGIRSMSQPPQMEREATARLEEAHAAVKRAEGK